MDSFLEVIVFILSIGSAMVFIFYSILFSVHKAQTRENSKEWGYGSFKVFFENFKKIEWEYKDSWSSSRFSYPTDSKIHAGIIKFNGKGMVISYFSYWKFLWFEHFVLDKSRGRKNKKLWRTE